MTYCLIGSYNSEVYSMALISVGSLGTRLKCGKIVIEDFVAILLLSLGQNNYKIGQPHSQHFTKMWTRE